MPAGGEESAPRFHSSFARSPIIRSLRAPLAALALILAVLAAFWPGVRVQPLTSYDQRFYLGMAHDLVTTGRFTDGFSYGSPGPDGLRPPGMRFVPLYPALVAGAALLEPPFRAAIACVVAAGPDGGVTDCPRPARIVRGVQWGMLALFYWLLWWTAGRVLRSPRGAWIALLLALPTAPLLLRSVAFVMTETTALLLAMAASAAAVAAWDSRRPGRWMLAAGVLLGLLTLTRPAFLYLFPAVVLVVVLAGWWTEQRRRLLAMLAVFALGFAIPTGPWIARNAIVLGRPALTHGYDSHTLVQRISFDAMTWREYGLAYLCWAPDGNALGNLVAGPHACDRFGWDDHPDSFYSIGVGPLMEQTVAAAGGWEGHMRYLLTHYILAAPVKHALVTVPLALRGMWIDHWWGFVLGIACAVMTVRAIRRRDVRFLILALPAWFMLLFNAAVAVNQVRYNLMLISPFAVAGAMVAENVLRRRGLNTKP